MGLIFVAILAAAFLVPLVVTVLVRRAWAPWSLAAVAIGIWGAYAIYIWKFYECPSRDFECDPGLGVFFLGILCVLWLAGIAAGAFGSALRRGLASAGVPRRRRP
jgi:hypothetical protein